MKRENDYEDLVHENRAAILRVSTEIGRLHNEAEYMISKPYMWFESEWVPRPAWNVMARFLDWKLRRIEGKKKLLEEELGWYENEERLLETLARGSD